MAEAVSVPPELDLSSPRRIHVVGVGGAGMNAIATVLAEMGHTVSGSDIRDTAVLDRLRGIGVRVHVGHSSDNVGDAEIVTYSTAVARSNPELAVAAAQGRPVVRRAGMLAAIAASKRTIAVAGTHGKTTTSSMLSLVLMEAGLRPSFVVGADLNEVGSGAQWGGGEWFVVEADESDGTFLELHPEVAVVTSVEPDHLGHYGSFDALAAAFGRFLLAAPVAVVCADDATAAALAAETKAVTYGTDQAAEYRISDVQRGQFASSFRIGHGDESLGMVDLPVPGLYNVRNATAAAVTALQLGVPFEIVARALGRYAGVARRFQLRGEWNGVTFVEDYAHLPTEVASVLAAARDGDWRRIVCVFQPHRYTRTADLWRDFADAFVAADVVVLTDIYSAGEEPIPGVTGKLVLNAVVEKHPGRRVVWAPARSEVARVLRSVLRAGDLCLLVGAGDLTGVPDELAAQP